MYIGCLSTWPCILGALFSFYLLFFSSEMSFLGGRARAWHSDITVDSLTKPGKPVVADGKT